MYTSHELEHKNITEMGPLLRVTPKIPKIPCSAPIKMASMLVSNIQTLRNRMSGRRLAERAWMGRVVRNCTLPDSRPTPTRRENYVTTLF